MVPIRYKYALLQIWLMCAPGMSSKAFDSASLKLAITDWKSDPSETESRNGHISDWDTSKVTSM